MRRIAYLMAYLALPACLLAQDKQAKKFAATITATDLKQKLSIIASAEMEGRETATEGQRKAAEYIKGQFVKNGLKEGNNGNFYQDWPVYQDEIISSSLSIYNLPFAKTAHYNLQLSNTYTGTHNISEVVFIGFTDDSLTQNINDKWVIVADGKRVDAASIIANAMYRDYSTFYNKLIQKGAKGILLVTKNFPLTSAPSAKGNMYTQKQATKLPVNILTISYQAAASMLNKVCNSFADLSSVTQKLYTTNANFSVDKATNKLSSSNVIGVIEGSDKKDEYVFITGHYDHLGKRGNDIYYGADDDGSGTTAVIEMAEAFAAAKAKGAGPRRTMVFMTVSGEEKGLWGSEYYSEHPIFPLEKTMVDLNIDMVGRIDPSYKGDSMNYVFAIGEDKLSSDLQPITDSVNKLYINMEVDRKYNDPNDKNRFYFRSDHYNFARKGVPVIFYFNGVHRDYHRTTDTVDKINFDLMEKRVKLVFYTAWEMANRNQSLKRDKPLPTATR